MQSHTHRQVKDKDGRFLKECLRCKKEFEVTGHNHLYCSKICQKRSWNESNYEKVLNSRRKHQIKNKVNPEYREKVRIWAREGKRRARNNPQAVKKDVIRSKAKLYKKGFCEKCGSKEDLELHHPDYTKPEGITLCREHHFEIHGRKILNKEVF